LEGVSRLPNNSCLTSVNFPINQEELKTLIPHRGKMFLLDRVTECDFERRIRAEYDITDTCLFFNNELKGVPSWAGFEFMAQTISAFSGIRGRLTGIMPKIGFILSVPIMRMYVPVFKTGSVVDIRMKECDRTEQIYTVDGEIFLEDKKVMEGKLMVMEILDEKQFRTIIEGV
jgi:predicted hotdog family 3-hydroxylacyl-ACP dehydratase